jgi:ribonuclease BN (tRNA processing enzyme)
MDYARLVMTRWDQGHGAIPELKVFGPPGTVEMTQALLGPSGAFTADIAARIHQQGSIDTFVLRGGVPPRMPPAPEVIEIQDGQKITGDNWQITAGNVPHAQPTLQCLGYRLDSAEGSLAYSGDAGKSQEFIGLIKGCEVLIHMCHQISGTEPNYEWVRTCAGHREVGEIAHAANIKTLVLSHIPSQMDVPGVGERLVCEIADIFEGHIIWGQDLMEISIDGPKPLPHTG